VDAPTIALTRVLFEAHVGSPLPRWRLLPALRDQAEESSRQRLVERLRIDPGVLTRQLKALEWRIKRMSRPLR
jgi:hypothetical protein